MDKNKCVKIGIVIPIYNTAPYLRECLDSVANQTYKNFHAVLVNDGSTDFVSNSSLAQSSRELEKSSIDRQQALSHSDFSALPTNLAQDTRIADLSKNNISQSLQIALEYVAKDSRFVLIDKENSGLSSARNAGIDYFNSECNFGNSSLELHSADFGIFGASQTPSLVSAPKIPKNYESQTENPSVVSNADSTESSLQHFKPHPKSLPQGEGFAFDSPSLAEGVRGWAKLTSNLTLYHNTKSTPNSPKIDHIIFLDSDDFWELDLLEKCVDLVRITHESNTRFMQNQSTQIPCDSHTSPDIIWFDWHSVGGITSAKSMLRLFGFTNLAQISANEWLEIARTRHIGGFWWAWSGLINFAFLRTINLRFLEGVIHEDHLFGLLLFAQSRRIFVLPQRLYNYRIRSDSITSDKQSFYHFASSFCAMSVAFADFCDGHSNRDFANRCKEVFLPSLLVESCDIFDIKGDSNRAKESLLALLARLKMSALTPRIIAKITHKGKTRFFLMLLYFAPRSAFFRALRKISRALGFVDG